jgi:subtilisin family serine protease
LKALTFWSIATGCLLLAVLLTPSSLATRQLYSPRPQTEEGSSKRRRAEFVPGDVLVRFKHGRAFEGKMSLTAPANSRIQLPNHSGAAGPQREIPADVQRLNGQGAEVIEGLRLAKVSPEDTLSAIEALKNRADVLYAEPNYILHADTTNPNDPRFLSGEMYAISKIGAPQAWDTTQGSKSIVVGVVDEGIDTSHEDLSANIWTNPAEIPGNGIDDDGNGFIDDVNGYNFFDDTGTVFSGSASEFHATHVAGTIGAVGNNSVGGVGVNWNVSLMSLKFLGAGGGSTADAVRAYNYAKQMHDLWITSNGTKGANIRVLNNSYGGGGYSQAAADAINALGQSGILFVAAAGNDAANNDTSPHYPANYSLSNVISVTSTDSNDLLSGFSDFGVHAVMMGAPGSSILSTTPNNTYSVFSGTSMATPQVTGAAALLAAANPNLSVSQIRALLAFNGDPIAALAGKTLTGRRLSVFNSLQALAANDTTAPGTVTNFQITSQTGRTVNLSWTDSGDDGAAGQASLYDISFVDQSSGAVIPMTTLAPATSGTTESVTVTIPYRHPSGSIVLREFDNVGNEGTPASLNVNVSTQFSDPYSMGMNAPASLSTGGTALGLTFDDRYLENYALPFSFPFFGQNFTTVTISTNGNLYFSPPPKRGNGDADDVPSAIADLSQFKMIAGMWDDLDLRTSRRADADVYVVTPDPSRIIFRWQGVQFGDGTNGDPINFEIELRSDGVITTRYGAGNTNLFPVVGISGGEPDPFVITPLTSELSPINLTNAPGAVFVPFGVSAAFTLVPVTIQTNPAGRSITVDGVTYTAPQSFVWAIASNPHTIATTASQSGVGAQYSWTSWSDGGAISHSVAPTSGVTYTANFSAQYQLTITTGPGGTVSPSTGFFNSGQVVTITASPAGSFGFNGWTGFGGGSFTGTLNPATVKMDGPVTETASFIQNTIQFSASTYAVGEGDTRVNITVTRSGDASAPASINYGTIDDAGLQQCSQINGTASPRCDFIYTLGTLTWAAGDSSSKSFSVAIIDDSYAEGPENFRVALSNPSGTSLGAQSTATVTINDNETVNGPNPIDGTNFFVRQQYIDFLGREPDPAGFAGWTSTINNCSGDTTQCDHIHVSQLFYQSIEFQSRGYYVFKFYPVSFPGFPGVDPAGAGHKPDYAQFAPDLAAVSGFLTDAQLDAAKDQFAIDFTNRTMFLARYALTMPATEYVDTLLSTAGVSGTFNATTRQNLINGLTGGTLSRAQALRQIVDSPEVTSKYFNEAFVVMEYFGYLRRDPDALYLNWLDVINQSGDPRGMVNGFANSGEYRQRFGP